MAVGARTTKLTQEGDSMNCKVQSCAQLFVWCHIFIYDLSSTIELYNKAYIPELKQWEGRKGRFNPLYLYLHLYVVVCGGGTPMLAFIFR